MVEVIVAKMEQAEPECCPPSVSLLNHVLAGIRAIETEYSTSIMRSVRKLAEELSSQMPVDEPGSETNVRERIASARRAFEDRILTAQTEWNTERQFYESELEMFDATCGEDIFREIAHTELAIDNSESHIQWMLRDTSVDLARIMRARMFQSELKAYLRGLRFRAKAQNPDAFPSEEPGEDSLNEDAAEV